MTGWRGGYGQDHRGPCRLVKKFGFIQWATRTHGWRIDQLKGSKIRVFLGEPSGCDVENRLEERKGQQ